MISSSECIGALLAEPGQVTVEVVLELVAAAGLRAAHLVQPLDRHRIDDLGAQISQLAERAAKYRIDVAIERRRVVGLMQHAEPRALQTVAAQRRRVVRVYLAARRRGRRIVRIFAGDHLQHRRGVGDGPRHGAGDVGAEVQRHDAGAADEAHRRSEADQRLVRRRPADRVAGIARERDRAEVRRRARPPSRRSSRR